MNDVKVIKSLIKIQKATTPYPLQPPPPPPQSNLEKHCRQKREDTSEYMLQNMQQDYDNFTTDK